MVVGGKTGTDERFLASGDEAGTAPDDRRFRPDVEGLRAVAVLLVVLYHADLPGLTGGYVGVDVFFVISGFVITGLLLRERNTTGRTSIVNFYARRCRRILPAATLVILITVFVTYVVLGIVTGNDTADDARWAATFLANLHFDTIGTNYLASARPPSPLQNYWSLSVEEQFYVIYPTLFLVLTKSRLRLSMRGRLATVLAFVIVASYWFSIVQTASHPTAAYFSPFTRAWELALGALVAVGTSWLKRMPARVAAALTWVGLAAILGAAFIFNNQSAYPGSLVALPVVGAAMIIAGGVAVPRYGVESLLGLPPFRWLGKLSYSLYLWHWPILIIAAERLGKSTLPLGENLLLLLLALALSSATYVFVENPIRHSRLPSKQSVGLGAGLIATTVVAFSVVTAAESAGASGYRVMPAADTRIVLKQVAAASRITDLPASIEPSLSEAGKDYAGPGGGLHYGCASTPRVWAMNGNPCTIGDLAGSHLMVVYGDSHILMWLPALDDIAISNHWRLVVLAKYFCPAELVTPENLPGFGPIGGPDEHCNTWHTWAVQEINKLRPNMLIVSQDDSYSKPGSGPFSFRQWEDGLTKFYGAIAAPSIKRIILGNIPLLPQSGPTCLSEHPRAIQACSASLHASLPPLDQAERAAVASSNALYVDPTPWFCSKRCTAVVGDYDVYLNQHHVTATYATYLQNALANALGFRQVHQSGTASP